MLELFLVQASWGRHKQSTESLKLNYSFIKKLTALNNFNVQNQVSILSTADYFNHVSIKFVGYIFSGFILKQFTCAGCDVLPLRSPDD